METQLIRQVIHNLVKEVWEHMVLQGDFMAVIALTVQGYIHKNYTGYYNIKKKYMFIMRRA